MGERSPLCQLDHVTRRARCSAGPSEGRVVLRVISSVVVEAPRGGFH